MSDHTSDEPLAEIRGVVSENKDAGQFELRVGGDLVSLASYRQLGSTVVLPHVETLRMHRGKGYAGQLMRGMLETLQSDGRKINPVCPFAVAYLRDNPRYHQLIAA